MQKLICFAVAILAFPATMPAQTSAMSAPSVPPIKMGLWQSTSTITMTGFQIPPDIAARLQAMGRPLPTGQPHTTIIQSCLTSEKWQKMFTDMQQDKDCEFTNQHQSSSGMSADLKCKPSSGNRASSGHIEANFLSSEKVNGKVHIVTITDRQPQPIVIDMHFESLYQGADCQGIFPDSPKIVH